MKSFVAFLGLVALATADVSHIVKGTEAGAEILSQNSDVGPEGFVYEFQTSNGIAVQSSGALKVVAQDAAAVAQQGAVSYTSPEGTVVQLEYVADENGFQPRGAHLPTPPPTQPIPVYILKSLDWIAAHPPKPEAAGSYRA